MNKRLNTIVFFVFFANQIIHAQSIYDKSIVILAHDHRFSESSFDGKNDFKEMISSGVAAKVICVVTDIQDWKDGKVVRLETDSAIEHNFGYPSWKDFYEGRIKNLQKLASKKNSEILIIKKATDFEKAKKTKKAGLILGTEGVRFLNSSTKLMDEYYNQGLRHIKLYREPLFIGAAIDSNGVTNFGKELIKKCNTLGIAIDVTHIQNLKKATSILSELSSLSSQPLICSHQHSKNNNGLLSDEQIKIIASSGNGKGVIGIHFISNYVNPLEVNSLVAICKTLKTLVGTDHIALGADYSPTSTYKWAIQDVSKLYLLSEALSENGFSESEIEKILGGNLFRFYDHVWSRK
jgi:microsomal dipeptidase-like Zn-dependent dipeptidase